MHLEQDIGPIFEPKPFQALSRLYVHTSLEKEQKKVGSKLAKLFRTSGNLLKVFFLLNKRRYVLECTIDYVHCTNTCTSRIGALNKNLSIKISAPRGTH
jgi:hypothetical protein